MPTFRDWIPEGEKRGSEGNGFTDFVPESEVKKEVKAKKEDKLPVDLTEEDIADLGVDINKLKALEEEK